jgi:hypothetical protein
MHLNQPHRVNESDLRGPFRRAEPTSFALKGFLPSYLRIGLVVVAKSLVVLARGWPPPLVDGLPPLPFTGLITDVASKVRRLTPPPDHGDASWVYRWMGLAD